MRSRDIVIAIVLIALPSVAAAACLENQECLINPSAEFGTTSGWTMISGNTWTIKPTIPGDPSPADDDDPFYFYPGADAATELHQWVSVRHLGPTIKAGRQVFEFSGWMYSKDGEGQKPDTAEIFVRYRNADTGGILYTYPVAHTKPYWRQVSHRRIAPTATTHIQVVLRATRWTLDKSNDAYFDGLSLTTRECKCDPCQSCGLDGICRPNSTLEGKPCELYSEDQEIALPNAVPLTIDKSCGKGTCSSGLCILPGGQAGLSRWEVMDIKQAAEGAVATIFAPGPYPSPFEYCLQGSLRQTMQYNLSGNDLLAGFRVKCVNSPYCGDALGIPGGNAACSCVSPSLPGVIGLNNHSFQQCAEFTQTNVGISPTLDETFEKTLFHELVHDKGGLGHTGDYATDRVQACDKACYGFETLISAENFALIDPQNCKYP